MRKETPRKTSRKVLTTLPLLALAVIALLRQTQTSTVSVLENGPLVQAMSTDISVESEPATTRTVLEEEDEPLKTTETSTRQAPKLPNLLLAGVQKCGTTALDNYLREQDLVCSAENIKDPDFKFTSSKELHFFDIKDRYSKGIDFYKTHFQHCNFEQDHKFLIDSTPNYQQHPHRIYQSYQQHDPEGLKNLKIIFTVREPVQREMSWFNHWSNSNRWQAAFLKDGYQPSFEQDYYPELVAKRQRNDLKGLYYYWFQKWFQLFDRKQILIIAYDEIKHNPQRALQRVHEFLDVPIPETVKDNSSEKKISGAGVIANRKQTEAPSCALQEQLLEWFHNDTQQFYQLLEDNPGPPMEQRPFPKFQFSCYKNPGGFAANTTTQTRQ